MKQPPLHPQIQPIREEAQERRSTLLACVPCRGRRHRYRWTMQAVDKGQLAKICVNAKEPLDSRRTLQTVRFNVLRVTKGKKAGSKQLCVIANPLLGSARKLTFMPSTASSSNCCLKAMRQMALYPVVSTLLFQNRA